jgi:hypothetical protein
MGGVIGRVVDSYADSDDDQLPIGFELQDRHDHPGRHEEVEIPLGELPPAAAASPLLFGGNAFANGDPQNPVNEVMLPLLQRLASSTPQLSHTRTVTCPFNVNKGSIKLVPRTTTANAAPSSTLYDLQFTIDATEACIVKVFYCVDEKSSHHSFTYCDAVTSTKIGKTPSKADIAPIPLFASSSSPSEDTHYIEKRFGVGLGQTFFTLGTQALDITKYPIAHLTWNQLEQQLETDKARVRSEDNDSNSSDNSDGETQADDADASEAANDDIDESSVETMPLAEIDEEEGLVPVRRNRERRRKAKKRKAALPRPKPLDLPVSVRNLFPIVITIEPVLEEEEKAVVEAQITHLCLVPSTSRSATPDGDDAASSSTSSDITYNCRVLRQKLLVNGSVYNVYDIFGAENEIEESGSLLDGGLQSTCVICMSEPRTTLVIPCRHMCLCEDCAETLKVQSVKCPICRGPVRSLLKIEVGTDEDDEQSGDQVDETLKLRRKRDFASDDAQDGLDLERFPTLTENDVDEDDEDDDNVHTSLVKGAK